MARLRRRDDNSDHMSRLQDARLLELEASINALYSQAAAEVRAEFARLTEAFEEEDKRQNARMTEGEITPEQYAAWRQNNILRSDKYQATVDSLTTMLVNTDIAAMEITRGQLPIATAESYNFVQALGSAAAEEAGLSMGTFQIYNADSIQAIMRDNRELLPHVDVPEDERWNHTRINREIATGILTGDSIPKVAERLQLVTNMDNNAAVRNARTAMTGAENLGRRESADRLREQGLPIKEVWSATYDNRTRETHLMLDGTEANEQGLFGVGILTTPLRYPGDPLGDPGEVYNCRCRLNVQIVGIDHSNDADLYEQFMRDNHPDDYAELQDQRDERQEAAERREAILAEQLKAPTTEMDPISASNEPLTIDDRIQIALDNLPEDLATDPDVEAYIRAGFMNDYETSAELFANFNDKQIDMIDHATAAAYEAAEARQTAEPQGPEEPTVQDVEHPTVDRQIRGVSHNDEARTTWIEENLDMDREEASEIYNSVVRYTTGDEYNDIHNNRPEMAEDIQNIDALLNNPNMPVFEGTVYRGVHIDDSDGLSAMDKINAIISGGTWNEPGITSFTDDRRRANLFASAVGGVDRTQGVNVLIINRENLTGCPIQHLSACPRPEHEVLFPSDIRDRGFEIISSRTQQKVDVIPEWGNGTEYYTPERRIESTWVIIEVRENGRT